MKISDQFRKTNDDYFRLSGIREAKKLPHTPFVVIGQDEITLCDNLPELLELDDDTDVIGQWQGKWRSDFFRFKVGDWRKYISENPKESYHVI